MKYLLTAFALLLISASFAVAARIIPDADFSLDVPNDWQSTRDVREGTPQSVAGVLECVDENRANLLMTGWKLEGDAVQAAFCVSYWRSGGAKTLNLLKGPGKQKAFEKFADIFASKIHSGYTRRKLTVDDLSATLVNAGQQAITTIDGRLKAGGKVYMRSDTVYLHGDAILNVSTIYDVAAPHLVGAQTDKLPMSVEWRSGR